MIKQDASVDIFSDLGELFSSAIGKKERSTMNLFFIKKAKLSGVSVEDT